MKYAILLVLFTMFSGSFNAHAVQQFKVGCRGGENSFLGASLVYDSKHGWLAALHDGYASSAGLKPNPWDGGTWYWMSCKKTGDQLRCPGVWSFRNSPTVAIFSTNEGGQVSVTFKRGLSGDGSVTLKCSRE